MTKEPKKRKKKDEVTEDPTKRISHISDGARHSVLAIVFLVIAIFLVIAELHGGGVVGGWVFGSLTWLLGVGYILLPILLAMLSVLAFRSFERRFGWVQVIGMGLLLLFSLGLIELSFDGNGGALGMLVSHPIRAAVDTTAAAIFLVAFITVSLVIAFDVHLGEVLSDMRSRLFARREEIPDYVNDVPNATISGLPVDMLPEQAVAPATDTHHSDEPAVVPMSKKSAADAVVNVFKSDVDDGFPIISATGSDYSPPPLSILAKNKGKPEVGDVKANMNIIKRTLLNFGIQVEMDEASIGPTVTRYAMKPAEGVRLSKILTLQSNLELALAVSPVRIEAPIPGKSLVGIEVPNIARTTLGLAPLLTEEHYAESGKPLFVALGRSITGTPQYADLARMPHLLVAGTTGAGKSVTIHDFVVSLLYRCGPERLRFIMVDPKRVELTLYNSIPHLLTPVITDAKKAILALKWLAKEMDRRYNILETHKVRDISSYHENVMKPAMKNKKEEAESPEAMPYIVVVVDELADIMQAYPRELESGIVRLAQMSRAVGIHLILSTQRPSVKVITGLIKANIPGRVALQVASQIDSRTILDMGGAEKLLGAGDMLFLSGDMAKPLRIQAPYISEGEVKQIVKYLAKTAEGTLSDAIDFSDPHANGGGTDPIFSSMIGANGETDEEDDELYMQAKQTVLEAGKASTSYLQRKLGIGYARAARLMDLLEDRGVIGPADGAKPRTIVGDGNADELATTPSEANEV